MYQTIEYESGEYFGTPYFHSIALINESYAGEAYDLFLDKTIHDGFSTSLCIKDDLNGDDIIIEATEHLSDLQIEFLKSLEDSESLLC